MIASDDCFTGATGLEPPVKEHIQRIYEQLILTLETHCSSTPERFDKMLLMMGTIGHIGLEMSREVEIQRVMSREDFNEEMLKKLSL